MKTPQNPRKRNHRRKATAADRLRGQRRKTARRAARKASI